MINTNLTRSASKDLDTTRDIILAHSTILDVKPPELIRIAYRAAYSGVAIKLEQDKPKPFASTNYSLYKCNNILDATLRAATKYNIYIDAIGPIRINDKTNINNYRETFELAEILGSKQAIVVAETSNFEQISRLCDLSLKYNTKLAIEFIPYTGIKTLRDAVSIVNYMNGLPNIAFDVLHRFRSCKQINNINKELTKQISCIHVCDTKIPQNEENNNEDVRNEASCKRIFPGDGIIPIRSYLDQLSNNIPLTLEVPLANRNYELDNIQLARYGISSLKNSICTSQATKL